MAKTVFILGAGASKHAGAPLMDELLEKARTLLATGNLGVAEKKDFELVRKGINRLQLVHSKADLDISNLEAVFDAFEMAALVGRLGDPGDLGEEDVKRLPAAMRTVILETLQREIAFPVGNKDGDTLPAPTPAYSGLVREVARRYRDTGSYPTVITFNYDMCLELALWFYGPKWTYCLNESEPSDGVKVLKLHGSLNWGFCGSCNRVGVSREMGEILTAASHDAIRARADGRSEMHMKVVTGPLQVPGCKCEPDNRAVMLVPPTINKGPYHAALSKVWAAAAAELSSAEDIFVCGYSLPETDLFFRYLYAVGTIGEASLRHVWVFNPDASVKPRFERLLGKQVRGQRNGFLVFPCKFEDDRMNWPVVLDHDLANLPKPV
jgi:hypothetical protein